MKKAFLISVLILLTNLAIGQEYVWNEVQIIEPGDVNGVVCKIDITENDEKLVLGYFHSSMTIETVSLDSSKPIGVFLAKYSESDELLWLKKIAESREYNQNFLPALGSALNIEIDDYDNIYISIPHNDTLFVEDIFYTSNDVDYNHSNFTLFKYTPEGDGLFDIRLEGVCEKLLGSGGILIDCNQNIYLSVLFGNDAFNNSLQCSCIVGNDTLSVFQRSGLLIKYNSVGEVVWTRTIDATGVGEIALVDDAIYAIGYSSNASDIMFENFVFTLPSFYEKAAYIAKFDTSGVFQWAKHFGVNGWGAYVQVFDIQVLDSDNILLLGKSAALNELNQVFFQDAPTLSGYVGGKDEFFIVNYDSSGNVKWNRMSDSDGYEYASSMAVNSQKNIYITGKYSLPLYFGEDTLTPSGADDVFIAAYDSLGTELWATSAGGGSYDLGKTLKFDSQDNLYLCGRSYSSSLQFGELNYNLTEPSIFLAKLCPNDIGIEELLNQDILIELYPNPNTGAFSIRSEQNLEQLEIYNLLGEKVFEKHFSKPIKQQEIETTLKTGVYFVLAKTETGNYTAQKMIVE